MTVYLNPFHARASEHHRDVHQFVATFGAGALDMLPSQIWDRLVLLRSTRGTGKTSLMRLFTVESLEWARTRLRNTDTVHKELRDIGAINETGPMKLGIFIDLDQDYSSLLDLPLRADSARRLFMRLLDVRIMVGALRSLLAANGLDFPRDVGEVELNIDRLDGRVAAMVERMGGPTGSGLLQYASETERSVLRLLDALLSSDVSDLPEGHNELYTLSILGEADLLVRGVKIEAQPLVMFDDGHKLERSQRKVLLDELGTRQTAVARWYAERFEALSDQELLGAVGTEGRDLVFVDLDDIARHGSSDGRRFQRGRYEKVLSDIARRRAASPLLTYAQEQQDFLALLDDDRTVLLGSSSPIVSALEGRVLLLAGESPRYAAWIASARALSGYDAAVRWRELEILVLRDQDRQQGLFAESLSSVDLDDRSSSALREAAALSVAAEFRLPYYGGSAMVQRLGSHNAQQFLEVCGYLFSEMLVDVSLGRPPRLSLERQHRVLRDASERMWEAIPREVPNGRDVQALVREIASMAKEENAKPKMPYPPGVTGTALLMGERLLLLDPAYRAETPGAERLFAALASAVAYNVLSAELDYSVKNNRYMVLNLNRLLCPRFGLPLGVGSFREKRLHTMLGWMRKLPASGPMRVRPREDRLPI